MKNCEILLHDYGLNNKKMATYGSNKNTKIIRRHHSPSFWTPIQNPQRCLLSLNVVSFLLWNLGVHLFSLVKTLTMKPFICFDIILSILLHNHSHRSTTEKAQFNSNSDQPILLQTQRVYSDSSLAGQPMTYSIDKLAPVRSTYQPNCLSLIFPSSSSSTM